MFQRAMECVLQSIDHTVVYVDDILVTGASIEEHLHTLVLSCTGLLSPNGDNKAYLFITIYTMSLENVEFFVLIIFNTYKMIF